MKELSKKSSCIVWAIISIIFGIVYNFACNKFKVNTNYDIYRIIIASLIAMFVGLHVIFGFKKLYEFIIDKRYIIALILLVLFTVFGINGSSIGANSMFILEPEKNNCILGTFEYIDSDEYAVEAPFSIYQKKSGMNTMANINGITKTNMNISVHVPTKNIVTLFRIYNIGYLFLSSSMALSFAWNFKFLLLILATYELMRILTKDRKFLSLIGTILVACSSFLNWWPVIEVAFGELVIISIDRFMLSKNRKYKILWSLVFAYSALSYILQLYLPYVIAFGYIFLGLAIWIIIKNWKQYKFEKIDLICFLGIILIIALVGICFYLTNKEAILAILNSSYPGKRDLENGGKGIKYLFSYLYSFMLPYAQNFDTKEVASFLSFFPIPLILGMVYLYKNEKNSEFLLPMLIVIVLEVVWCMSGLPTIVSKITLLNKVPIERCAVAIELGSIYLYMYMFANIKEKVLKQTHALYIILAILALLFFIPLPDKLNTRGNLYIFAMIEALCGFSLLNIGDKNYEKIFLFCAVVITLISGITINPIAKGTSVMTDTKLAKKVQEEVAKNENSIWITENIDMVVTNYLVSQGAKTLNATQTYPSQEFWKLVLGSSVEKYKDIWNRYSHIEVEIIDNLEDCKVELVSNDLIKLYLTPNKLKELGVAYIVTYKNLEEVWKNGMSIEKIYSKNAEEDTKIFGEKVEGIYIYQFVN